MRRYRCNLTRANFMMIGIPSAATAFLFWAQGNSRNIKCEIPMKEALKPFFNEDKSSTNTIQTKVLFSTLDTSPNESGHNSKNGGNNNFARSFRTPADKFYHKNRKIPLPAVLHATLSELSAASTTNRNESKTGDNVYENEIRKNILVIGDVHGCYDELLELHAKAVEENGSMQFQYIVMVGDLCNKGPQSAKVIRHVRLSPGWFSVRGNHDDAALAAALGDPTRLQKKTYEWVKKRDGEERGRPLTNSTCCTSLCDDDVEWLSQLPYTIKISGELLGENEDTLIVHAGLIPYCDIQDQKISTMTTIRDLLPRCNENGDFTHFEYHNGSGDESAKIINVNSTKHGAKLCCEVKLSVNNYVVSIVCLYIPNIELKK